MTTPHPGPQSRWQGIARIAAPGSAFLFGALLCLYYGRDGFMPIDQSIIYDGAWRVLCGQVPLRDFLTPTGIVPILVQAAFFSLLGVNWFAYCLHAAVFNGLFAALAYVFLRQWGLHRAVAWVSALLSGIVMYVPSGTPLMEQDAFLFILLACVLALAGARAGRRAHWLWFVAGLCLLAAALSKQNPALFGLPLVVWTLWTQARDRRRSSLLWLFAGAAAGATLVAVAAAGLGVSRTWARLLLWEMPGQVGHERLALLHIGDPDQNWERSTIDKIHWAGLPLVVTTTQALAWLWLAAHVVRAIRAPRSVIKRITRAALLPPAVLLVVALYLALNDQSGWATHVPVAARWLVLGLTLVLFGWRGAAAAGLVALIVFGRERCGRLLATLREQTDVVVMMQGLMLACVAFFSLTLNEECNGVPYYFIAMGLAFEALRRVCQSLEFEIWMLGAWRRHLLPAAVAGVALVAVLDGVRFHREVNLARIVNDDQKAVRRNTTAGGSVSPALAFMRFHVADVHQQMVAAMGAGDYRQVIDFFRLHRGNYFLFGDSSILYSLTGRPSASPALWFHSGLVFPQPESPHFQLFESWLTQRIDEQRCAYVVIEGRATLFGLTPDDFPELRRLIDTRGRARHVLGAFTVVELAPPSDGRVASRR